MGVTQTVLLETIIKHLMYADDLVIFSAYSLRLQQLLRMCSPYGKDCDIKFNDKKSNVMVVRSREDRKLVFSCVSLV